MGVTYFYSPTIFLVSFSLSETPTCQQSEVYKTKSPALSMGDTFQNPQIVSSPIYTMILPVFAYL